MIDKKYKAICSTCLIASLFIALNSCKKNKDEGKIYDTSRDGKDPDLYGTWKTRDTAFSLYYEFVKDSIRSCYSLKETTARYKFFMGFKVSNGQIMFGGFTYPNYKVEGDTVFLMDKNKKVINTLSRVDNNKINYKTWLRQVKILASFKAPRNFIKPNGATNLNFGVDGDTLYYFGNHNYLVKYNPFRNEYYDSISVYQAHSIAVTSSSVYFLSAGKLFEANKSLTQATKRHDFFTTSFKMSLDVSNMLFYLWNPSGYPNNLFKSNTTFSASAVELFKPVSSLPENVAYYKDNKFLELSNGNLHISQFINDKTSLVNSYELPEGYNYWGYVSTNGSDVWLVAGNFISGKHTVLKVDLD